MVASLAAGSAPIVYRKRQEFDAEGDIPPEADQDVRRARGWPVNCDTQDMSIGPLSNLTNSYLQSILSGTLQQSGSTGQTSALGSLSGSSLAAPADSGTLSPFAQILTTLQQIQESNPSQYQQVTQQIATNLQNAAQAAQSQGNTAAANQLNQLSSDFSSASQSGQLPNIQDLAQAVGGGHHHHHHQFQSSATDSDGSSAQGQQPGALNPMSIILNTLSSSTTSPAT